MSGKYGYNLVSKTMVGIMTSAAFLVWLWKNRTAVVTQATDTQPDEFVGLISQAATVELPKVWDAFTGSPEAPLA